MITKQQLGNHSKVFWSHMCGLIPGYREAVRLQDGYVVAAGTGIHREVD